MNRHFRKILDQGGEDAGALVGHVERRRAIFVSDEFEFLPRCIQEYERCKIQDMLAFQAWKGRLEIRIENGELPLALRDADELGIVDMIFDVKAHSVRKATGDQKGKFETELRDVPVHFLEGVLRWYNFLAVFEGESGCDNLEELLIDISCRAKSRDKFILRTTSRAWLYLGETYVRLMGRIPWAQGAKEDTPWHALKSQETLGAEERGSAKQDEYYMSDDELKFVTLLVAVEDRRRHNITDMPALSNVEFRSSFTAGRGATLALENNDLISAAETARRNFSHLI